jgi:hypothetical protein
MHREEYHAGIQIPGGKSGALQRDAEEQAQQGIGCGQVPVMPQAESGHVEGFVPGVQGERPHALFARLCAQDKAGWNLPEM